MMDRVVHTLTVSKVEADSPGVCVTGHFYEGGTQATNSKRTPMSFLTSSFDQPKVGDELLVFIRPKTADDMKVAKKDWTA